MRNPNPVLPNKNTLYIGRSGAGKSQALKQNKDVPKSGVRVVLWDTNEDHKATRFYDMSMFLKALKLAHINYLKTKKGFRIAFCGDDSIKNYNTFCSAVLSMLDGRFLTYVIVEELAAVCLTAQKAPPIPARMMNQGRKYGMIFHGTTQRPQEISKTYFTQCEVLYAGAQTSLAQQKKIADELGVRVADVAALGDLQFYRREKGDLKKLQFKYKA